MNIYSWHRDRKIKGLNCAIDATIGEYWATARDVIYKNELQRKRVSSGSKTYRLLKSDLLDGCIMPPIILAVTEKGSEKNQRVIADAIAEGPENHIENLDKIVSDAFASNELLILDGLQRTYTIRDCINESENGEPKDRFLRQPVRLEVYLGLSKPGILYRMLTLNTGQTPMSFRHQIEILYNDYLKPDSLPDGIEVFKEKELRRARGSAKYKFNDVVDMFYAYSTGKPQSMDRQTLVAEIAEIDFLQQYRPDHEDDLSALLVLYNKFVRKLEEASPDWAFDSERLLKITRPFGKSISAIFERSQPMTAFGAELKRLQTTRKIENFSEVEDMLVSLDFSGDPEDAFDQLLLILDEIASTAAKIGSAQRDYFRSCFRVLLNGEFDGYLDLNKCWIEGQEIYNAMYGDLG